MEEIKRFLEELGIQGDLEETNEGSFIMDFPENKWGYIYSKLDKSEDLEEQAESNQLTEDNCYLSYLNDRYIVVLNCDFNEGIYKLIITER